MVFLHDVVVECMNISEHINHLQKIGKLKIRNDFLVSFTDDYFDVTCV